MFLNGYSYKQNHLKKLIYCCGFLALVISCNKFVSVGAPQTQITSVLVYSDDKAATSAISGLYSMLINSGFGSGGNTSLGFLTGLSADEFVNYSSTSDQGAFFTNNLLPTNGPLTSSLWSGMYSTIYQANAVLEGLAGSSGVSSSTHQELKGEAEFIRAFCAFYLVNLFGDVPLPTTTDYRINNIIARSSASAVYQQIIKDLQSAENELPADFSLFGEEKIRPTKWAAKGMLARVYLYTNDWADAEALATEVINNTSLFALDGSLDDVFLKNSTEAIWQLKPVVPGLNTNEGNVLILLSTPTEVSLNPVLVHSFEPGDIRRNNWIGVFAAGTDSFYFPFKYKVKASADLTEYSMVLRLAEQYLIRAEARVEQNDLTDGTDDLNIIRNRAGLPETTAIEQNELLLAIESERQKELFTEWGHRWLDLKRTGRADDVFTSIKPSWQPTDALYPIPQVQLQNDPNVSQNPGY